MRKLIILKSIVDFVWILGCIPIIFFLPIFYVYGFFEPDAYTILFEGNKAQIAYTSVFIQCTMLLFIVLTFTSIYSFYLFRKTLRFFSKAKPFHIDVIKNFRKIGILLVISGTLGSMLSFITSIIIKNELKLNLGLSPYLIILCLGLFFMVLSEVFKVAKHAKEENELTV